MTTPAASAGTAPSGSGSSSLPMPPEPVARLPPYFPLMHPKCAEPTQIFFRCFEGHAKMKDTMDVESPKTALSKCQPEVWGYMRCMEEHYVKQRSANKPWWKVW